MCKFLTSINKDDVCRKHPVTPCLKDKYRCVLNKTSQHCEETLNCDQVSKSEKLDCKNFATDVGKMCIKNEKGSILTKILHKTVKSKKGSGFPIRKKTDRNMQKYPPWTPWGMIGMKALLLNVCSLQTVQSFISGVRSGR